MTLSIRKLECLIADIAEKIMDVQLLHGEAIDLFSEGKVDSTVGARIAFLEPFLEAFRTE